MSRGWGAAAAAILLMTFVLLGGGLSTVGSQAPASGLETADLSTLDEASVSPESGIEAGGDAPAGSGAGAGGGETTAAGGDGQIEAAVDGELSEVDATSIERAALLFGYVADKLGMIEAEIDLDSGEGSAGEGGSEASDAQEPAASEDPGQDAESEGGIDFDLSGGPEEALSDTAGDDPTAGDDQPADEDPATNDDPTTGDDSVADTLSETLDSVTPSMLGGIVAALLVGYLYVSNRSPIAAIVALPTILSNWIVTGLYRLATAFERIVRDLYSVVSLAGLRSVIVGWVTDLRKSASSAVSGSGSGTDATGPSNTEQDADDGPVPAREQIRAAWARLIDVIELGQYHRRTPAEVRRRALADGQPSDSVTELTRAFRAVEYGEEDAAEYVESAERAAARLEETSEPTADDESTEDGGGSTPPWDRLLGRGGGD